MNRRDALKQIGLTSVALSIADSAQTAAVAVNPRSPEAVFCQLGFTPREEKFATVIAGDSRHETFEVHGEHSKQPVFKGKLSAARLDAASGDHVAIADFSTLIETGTYRLQFGRKKSEPFTIGSDVYKTALRLAVRSYYGQRCGCAVDLGGGYSHPVCHLSGAYHPTSGKAGLVRNHGGWHDAGDYGRYVVNSGITVGTLLWAWELYPEALRGLALQIPDSGGKVPDYLAEVQWNLQWMLSMQEDDGGVWHKQTSETFCGFIMPQQDQMTSYIIGTGQAPYKSTSATADLVAVMAIAARCYGPYDPIFADSCLRAARRGWEWAIAHPDCVFRNPRGIATGEYGDKDCGDEILWAAAELWRTTGDAQYAQAFLKGVAVLPPERAIKAPSWADVAPMAYWTYALSEQKGSSELKDRVRQQTSVIAKELMERRQASGYGNTLALADFEWGSNSTAANQSMLLLMADRLQQGAGAKTAALGNLQYLLGRNCFAISWVTQVGTRPFLHPHHRPSFADGIDAPWPGLLSGGPNAKPADEVAKTVVARAPMRMWIDDYRAYSMNEVAINWNAPLVFLLAAANS